MEDTKNAPKVPKAKSSKKKIILIAAVCLVLLLIAGFIFFFFMQDEAEDLPLDEVQEEVVEETREFEEGEPVLIWTIQQEQKINSLAVSPDGETFAVGEYLTSYIYHLADGELEQVNVYRHSAEDMEFSPDGEILAAGLSVYGVNLTSTEDGSEIWNPHVGYNNKVSFSPTGDILATGNRRGIIWFWDLETQERILELEEEETSWILSLEYHPSGDYITAVHYNRTRQNGYINIWDIQEEEIIKRIELNYRVSMAFHPFKFSLDGDTIIYVDMDEERNYWLYFVDFETGEEIQKLEFASGSFRSLEFSPDGSMIAVGESLYRPVKILDAQTGELLYTFDQEGMVSGVSNWIYHLAFTPDGKHVVVTRGDDTVELWRLPGGEPIEPRPRDISNPPPIPSDVLFDAGESVLKASADEQLEEFAQELYAEFQNARITFIGHTTSFAEADYNLQLSTERALAVRTWFEQWAEDNGAEGWELLSEGRGSTELKVPDFDSEGNFLESAGALNRRVEIEIEVID